MSYSLEYIDIILLAMIAGFIFLRLRGILGKRTGYDGKPSPEFEKEFLKNSRNRTIKKKDFDEVEKKNFLQGAKIAYETIITDFSDSDNKLIKSKPLLSKKIHDQVKDALSEREAKSHFAEITFIGIISAEIKEHEKVLDNLEVTVDFVSELITCIRDKDKKIISGDPEKIKKVHDTWKFSKNVESAGPNWLLIDTIT